MKPRIKIFYVPSLISVIGIPTLFCFYFFPSPKQERMLPIVFAAKFEKYSNEQVVAFDISVLSKPQAKRKYIDVKLNDIKTENDAKLNQIRSITCRLIKNKDTLNGVHVIFDKSCKFETFIKVVNNLKIDSIPMFIPFENNIWIPYIKNSEIKYREYNKKTQEEQKTHNYWKVKPNYSNTRLFSFLVEKWPISLMYLLLLVFSIYKVLKKI